MFCVLRILCNAQRRLCQFKISGHFFNSKGNFELSWQRTLAQTLTLFGWTRLKSSSPSTCKLCFEKVVDDDVLHEFHIVLSYLCNTWKQCSYFPICMSKNIKFLSPWGSSLSPSWEPKNFGSYKKKTSKKIVVNWSFIMQSKPSHDIIHIHVELPWL